MAQMYVGSSLFMRSFTETSSIREFEVLRILCLSLRSVSQSVLLSVQIECY